MKCWHKLTEICNNCKVKLKGATWNKKVRITTMAKTGKSFNNFNSND